MAPYSKELVQKRGLRVAQIIADARRIPRDYGPPKGTPRSGMASGHLNHSCRWCTNQCMALVPPNHRVPVKRNGRVYYQPLQQQNSILKCESMDGHLSISLRDFAGPLAWKSGSVLHMLDDPWVEARDVWGVVARVRRGAVRSVNHLSAEAKTYLLLVVLGLFAVLSKLLFWRVSQALPNKKGSRWALDRSATLATVLTTLVACAILVY